MKFAAGPFETILLTLLPPSVTLLPVGNESRTAASVSDADGSDENEEERASAAVAAIVGSSKLSVSSGGKSAHAVARSSSVPKAVVTKA